MIKLMMFALFMSLLCILKDFLSAAKVLYEKKGKISFTKTRTLLLFLSISYVMTIIITGFNF